MNVIQRVALKLQNICTAIEYDHKDELRMAFARLRDIAWSIADLTPMTCDTCGVELQRCPGTMKSTGIRPCPFGGMLHPYPRTADYDPHDCPELPTVAHVDKPG